MGGPDDNGEGLPYSQRLSNLAPRQTPTWTLEPMMGQPRIEGVGVLLPDGTVFLCSGAAEGARPLLPFPHGCSSRVARTCGVIVCGRA